MKRTHTVRYLQHQAHIFLDRGRFIFTYLHNNKLFTKKEIQTLGWRFSWSFKELVWLDLASSWSVVNVVWLETKQSCSLLDSLLDFVRLRCRASAGRPGGKLGGKLYFLVFWFSLKDNNKDLTWCRRLVRGNWWGVRKDKNFKGSNGSLELDDHWCKRQYGNISDLEWGIRLLTIMA